MVIHARNLVPSTTDRALGGSVIEKSLKFFSGASTELTRTPSGAGNRRTWTLSFWTKICSDDLGSHGFLFSTGADSQNKVQINLESNNRLTFEAKSGGSTQAYIRPSSNLRDISAWYHFVIRVDTTDGTSSNRVKIYINGTQQTDLANSDYPSQNTEFEWNKAQEHNIGKRTYSSSYFNGYLTEIHFIDGYAYDSTYFGYTDFQTGIWRPKRYEGTYGTNGYYLEFKDNSSTSALGKDTSGNGNDFTANNFSVSANLTNDSMPDTPSKNFCTLNALNATSSFNFGSFEGGLVFDQSSNDQAITGTLGVTSGKWYWEVYKNASQNPEIGIETLTQRYSAQSTASSNTEVAFITNNGEMRKGADSNSHSITGGSAQTGAGWIRIACDMDNKKIWFSDTSGNYFNSGNPATGTNEAFDFSSVEVANGWTPYIYMGTGSGHNCYINFGQFDLNSFSSNIPTGFKTLNSKNLIPDVPSIIRPQKHFETLTYTGNNASGRKITGLEFKPDFVWFKKRSSGTQNHTLYDSLRGAGKRLMLPSTSAEGTVSDELTSFNDGGFTIDTDNFQNENGKDYVAWCWKAGGAAAVSNTSGSITSSVSANQEGGFSIVKWTGTNGTGTVGHGLGKAPKWIIIRRRDSDSSWVVYHDKVGNTKRLTLDSVGSESSGSANWFNNTSPTSTTFSVGADGGSNGSTDGYVAWCWSEIPGFSKFGSYKGNNNSGGTYIHLGFRPAWVMIKNREAGSTEWYILDSSRDPNNPTDNYLSASSTAQEQTYVFYDFLSEGFKLRNTGGAQNPDNQEVIYMAFAEQPGTTPFETFPNAR